jgi:hypothetical protein
MFVTRGKIIVALVKFSLGIFGANGIPRIL